MAKRKRVWKINPVLLLLLSAVISFGILWSAKDLKPVKKTYENILSSNSVRGSLFGKIIEKIRQEDNKDTAKEFENLIAQIEAKPGIYGIFIKNISTGETYKHNHETSFYAASLYKIPLAAATLREVENNTIKLTDSIVYEQTDYYPGSGYIQSSNYGSKYTIESLLSYLLKQSDNVAQNILIKKLGDSTLEKAFKDISAGGTSSFYSANVSTPQEISAYIESLQKTGYLSGENKQKLWTYMINTSFDDRISQHLDSDIVFSHKIGNWGVEGTWHDCGIILTDDPLVVCLMSKNTTFLSFMESGKEVANFINYYYGN